MSIKIGVIAEDTSDIEVITEILSKHIEKSDFSIKKFVGRGCGKLKIKCGAWVDNLSAQGCSHILIFHDLDSNKEDELRKEINTRINNCKFKETLIVIPTEELEAWLLTDAAAIKSTFTITQDIKIPGDVEKIKSPKEFLCKLIKRASNKNYINTIHNKKIAEKLTTKSLSTCPSYRAFESYVNEKIIPSL
ncbi:DUF4276 family protein [uncultured Pseudomonas sp.]|uniref:DUF4276 family protein n=1 Tax=uncultured Pseudomonas sp. TaxID=114707 RepID=UPI00258EDB4C|nr:DUF4276 family protein [uncultured Pseudomonas sp.]